MLLSLIIFLAFVFLTAVSLPLSSRRSFIAATATASTGATILVAPPHLQPCLANEQYGKMTNDKPDLAFQTIGYGQEEYTNSITASRDTNISPREAYDVIRERIPKAFDNNSQQQQQQQRVLDVGAGAGVSTAVLYNELGYHDIDAVDWSADAWDDNVVACPDSVRFYALADDAFFQQQAKNQTNIGEPSAAKSQYSVICYNFAINFKKAERVAQQHLADNGILLAPVNDKADYWYKQSYFLLNKQGKILWKSTPEVGAWSVQFQPDVTSDTCTGIWCGGFNSFR